MTFAYYTRLSRAQQAIYRKSDQVSEVRLPRPELLHPLVEDVASALASESREQTWQASDRLLRGLARELGVPPVRLEVLAARPHRRWGELHGLYTAEQGHTPKIQLWMRTAKQRRVVAFRTYLRTLLHELGHHLDYMLLRLPDSFHTEGFYKRESSLFHQLVPERSTAMPTIEEYAKQTLAQRLARLERTGIISQDSNQRWYAGPLRPELVREHFQMRWLLEPAALIDAAPRIPREELVGKQSHVTHLKDGHKRPRLLERIEEELHIELTERCHNSQLKYALRRSQLPLFATHSTYRRFQDAEEIVRMAGEHWSVFDHLLAGDARSAAKVLEAHVKRSMEHNAEVLKLLPRLPDTPLPDYLVPIKLSRD